MSMENGGEILEKTRTRAATLSHEGALVETRYFSSNTHVYALHSWNSCRREDFLIRTLHWNTVSEKK